MKDIRKLLITEALSKTLLQEALTKTLLQEDTDYKIENSGIKLSDKHANSQIEIKYPSSYDQNQYCLNNNKVGNYFSNKITKSRNKNKAAKKARRLNRK